MRRATFLLASLMLFSSATLAQILPTLSYQAVLTDTIGAPKPDGAIIGNAVTALVRFDGSRLASGVYLYRIHSGTYVESRKLLLLR